MILGSLHAGLSDRIRQSFIFLQHLRNLDGQGDEELIKAQKGMMFVSLYACIEYTLTNGVSAFLSNIQLTAAPPSYYKIGLMPVLLNREFNSVLNGSKRNIWENKLNLVRRIFSTDPCTIDNDVFPADGINISADHFSIIWEQLHLTSPPLPPSVNPWLINEIKEHRNAIAHGREKAASIGARFTIALLEDRHQAVEALCTHTVMSLEEHLQERRYLMNP